MYEYQETRYPKDRYKFCFTLLSQLQVCKPKSNTFDIVSNFPKKSLFHNGINLDYFYSVIELMKATN